MQFMRKVMRVLHCFLPLNSKKYVILKRLNKFMKSSIICICLISELIYPQIKLSI